MYCYFTVPCYIPNEYVLNHRKHLKHVPIKYIRNLLHDISVSYFYKGLHKNEILKI